MINEGSAHRTRLAFIESRYFQGGGWLWAQSRKSGRAMAMSCLSQAMILSAR
jgi:hypothetical protein